ncbi:hypothetical protein ACFGVS_00740 [Mucilaginibacter sp. AW1-7]|uniref:hypothetical protein n=1 Tax=Mucilaginibacter sp. AW1-7 TaxID=3349874 RepID=UPI003F7360EF
MKKICKKISNWITSGFRPLFLLVVTGLLLTGTLTQKDKSLVTTLNAPKGILNWEINTNNTVRNAMISDWQATYKNIISYGDNDQPDIVPVSGIQTVLNENRADYAFIAFYVAFFLLLISRLVRTPRYNRKWRLFYLAAAGLTIIAGLLDVVEDLGTSRILTLWQQYHNFNLPDAAIVGYPGRLKWLVLFIVASALLWQFIVTNLALQWLELATFFLRKGVKLFWRFRVMLLTLLIVFAVLYISDQGQDLLLSINASRTGVSLFLFSATVIALLCWYLPKVLEYPGALNYAEFFYRSVDFQTDPATGNRKKAEVDLSRLLGAAGFLVPATGILKVMDNYHMDYWLSGVPPVAIMAIILLLYKIILEHHWIDRFFKKPGGGIHITRYAVTVAVLVIPIVLWGMDKENTQPYAVIHLALDLIILSIIFLITTTLRTCSPAIARWPVAPFVTLTGLACLLFFIACNWPSFLHLFIYKSRFYTMPFVFFAVAGYLLFFSYLMFIGKKTGVTWITLLLTVAFLGATGSITNYHAVAVQRDTSRCKTASGRYTSCAKTQDSLTSYTEKWLLGREKEIADYTRPGQRKYPVYFVNAYGGGIRAAVWATMVIGQLDKEMRADTAKASQPGFQHYAFSYSGASGGTVGLMLLSGARYHHLDNISGDSTFYPQASRRLYGTDNLTSDIIALLGRDLVYSGFGLSGVPDRARLMEMDWEKNAWDDDINLKVKIADMWKATHTELPLLFSNTYDIPSGNKGIIAPVLLDTLDFPSAIFPEQEIPGRGGMFLSTAGFLSARFPYVSPTAKLNHNRHFTDGGTIENSGGETSLQVIRVFEKVRKKLLAGHPALANISINILSLPNSIPEVENPVYDKSFYEPLGPPLGILNLGGANARRADLVNSRLKAMGYHYVRIEPRPYKLRNKKFWPVLPLGWQISDVALEAMQYSAELSPSGLDTVFQEFGIKRKKQ